MKYFSTDNVTGQKNKVVVVGGVHANESFGDYTRERLVGSDLKAVELPKQAECHICPMVNPEGRFADYNRVTVEHISLDSNRYWDSPNCGGMDDIEVVGDLQGDVSNDLADLGLFENVCLDANGLLAFEALIVQAPEPTAVVSAVTAHGQIPAAKPNQSGKCAAPSQGMCS